MSLPPISPGPGPTPATAEPTPAPAPTRPGWVVPVIAALAVLLIAAAGAVGYLATETSRQAAAQATTPATTAPPTKPRTTSPRLAYVTPKAQYFTLTLSILRKQCFGSAGCNITFAIGDFAYTGGPIEPGSRWDVTYEVTGGEDPFIATFRITGGTGATLTASELREERISTPSSASELVAKVTAIAER